MISTAEALSIPSNLQASTSLVSNGDGSRDQITVADHCKAKTYRMPPEILRQRNVRSK